MKYETIYDLELKVDSLKDSHLQTQKEMYFVLEYIRTSRKWKENYTYKKSSFWTYINDRFAIREATYRNNTNAFIKHPDQAIKYGPGLITKIGKVCGRDKTKSVLDEIDRQSKNYKRPMSRDNIEKIVQGHKKQIIKKEHNDWKAMYEVEVAAHERTKEELRDAHKFLKEKDKQIRKLKQTAGVVSDIRSVRHKPIWD